MRGFISVPLGGGVRAGVSGRPPKPGPVVTPGRVIFFVAGIVGLIALVAASPPDDTMPNGRARCSWGLAHGYIAADQMEACLVGADRASK